MLHRFIAVMLWSDQSQGSTVVDAQWQAVKHVHKEHIREKQVFKQHRGSSTVLTMESNQSGGCVWASLRLQNLFKEICKPHPAPSQCTP
ncbi:MAG TPA: hypothetical protein VJM53_09420 [Burkholderiales bacterium]|nr:hypothetical protein [Burkholderiales bacterium]